MGVTQGLNATNKWPLGLGDASTAHDFGDDVRFDQEFHLVIF